MAGWQRRNKQWGMRLVQIQDIKLPYTMPSNKEYTLRPVNINRQMYFCIHLIAHRSQSYPHGVPTKPIMKRRDSKESSRTQSFDTSITTSPSSTATGTPLTSPQKSLSHAIDEESGEPQVSQRAGHSEPHSDSDGDGRRVQFNKTSASKPKTDSVDQENEEFDENPDEAKKKIKGYVKQPTHVHIQCIAKPIRVWSSFALADSWLSFQSNASFFSRVQFSMCPLPTNAKAVHVIIIIIIYRFSFWNASYPSTQLDKWKRRNMHGIRFRNWTIGAVSAFSVFTSHVAAIIGKCNNENGAY